MEITKKKKIQYLSAFIVRFIQLLLAFYVYYRINTVYRLCAFGIILKPV